MSDFSAYILSWKAIEAVLTTLVDSVNIRQVNRNISVDNEILKGRVIVMYKLDQETCTTEEPYEITEDIPLYPRAPADSYFLPEPEGYETIVTGTEYRKVEHTRTRRKISIEIDKFSTPSNLLRVMSQDTKLPESIRQASQRLQLGFRKNEAPTTQDGYHILKVANSLIHKSDCDQTVIARLLALMLIEKIDKEEALSKLTKLGLSEANARTEIELINYFNDQWKQKKRLQNQVRNLEKQILEQKSSNEIRNRRISLGSCEVCGEKLSFAARWLGRTRCRKHIKAII